jgi:tRNA(Ile)-lysidine synthase
VRAELERAGAIASRICVAVSGGPDSTALLIALNELRRESALELVAAHANHKLRGNESEQDEQFVRELCNRLNVPAACKALPVPLDAADRQRSIEVTARECRLQFLAQVSAEYHASFIATAHTADDQAETVLHRIVRGTGLTGLAGIPASRTIAPGITLIRPLLHLRRHHVHAYLESVGHSAREDSSNRDLSFTRNRLRHEVLPYLASHINPQIGDALIRLAELAGEAQKVIDGQVKRLMRRATVHRKTDQVVWNVDVLRRAPRYLVCEAFRRLWSEQAWPQRELGQSELTQLADMVRSMNEFGACHLPGAIAVRRERNRLLITVTNPPRQ